MDYTHRHLREWVLSHPIFDLSLVSDVIGVSLESINDFIVANQKPNEALFSDLSSLFSKYGYVPLQSE